MLWRRQTSTVMVLAILAGCMAPAAPSTDLLWWETWTASHRSASFTLTSSLDSDTAEILTFTATEQKLGMISQETFSGYVFERSQPTGLETHSSMFVATDHGVPHARFLEFERNGTLHYLEFPQSGTLLLPDHILLALPLILLKDSAERFLPARLPVSEWRDKAMSARTDTPLILSLGGDHEEGPVWQASYWLDESGWPTSLEVTSSCQQECPPLPSVPAVFERTALAEPASIPVASFPMPGPGADSVPAFPVPALEPGGLAKGLGQAIQDAIASNDEVERFISDHAQWFVQQARFNGQSLQGETTWDVVLSSGASQGEALSFQYHQEPLTSPVDVVAPEVSQVQRTEGGSPRVESDSSLTVPVDATTLLPPFECRTLPLLNIVSMGYDLGPFEGATKPSGEPIRSAALVHVNARGVGAECSNEILMGFYDARSGEISHWARSLWQFG